jgi:hypothetical protein
MNSVLYWHSGTYGIIYQKFRSLVRVHISCRRLLLIRRCSVVSNSRAVGRRTIQWLPEKGSDRHLRFNRHYCLDLCQRELHYLYIKLNCCLKRSSKYAIYNCGYLWKLQLEFKIIKSSLPKFVLDAVGIELLNPSELCNIFFVT